MFGVIESPPYGWTWAPGVIHAGLYCLWMANPKASQAGEQIISLVILYQQ
jgi:hypothetical protein